MKYKAILCGVPGMERPLVQHGNTRGGIDEWATVIMKKYGDQGGWVEIYESRDVLIDQFPRPLPQTVVAPV